ncbi:MAG TPA: 2-amino-4-hydroxy-6-hydroxymethyldihydropteridine diphosphokinase [Rhizomicrobium sp.]|nr:2-amino-4-hydroxy-6-hydroxymethyldihydropteridine diphosphokinase [Rhizomicrobium sp.]
MILVALGGNLASHAGTPTQTLDAALASLARHGVKIISVSPYYVTPAWPDPADPSFVNAVAQIDTILSPAELLALLHQTETAFGRARSVRNAPRTLDLDILDYDNRVEQGAPDLPHPRLTERSFVLVPLSDIAPDWRDPVSGRHIADLLAALPEGERNLPRLAKR